MVEQNIYNEDNSLIHSVDIKCENEKNSTMEKIGIDYCLNYIASNNINNYTTNVFWRKKEQTIFPRP